MNSEIVSLRLERGRQCRCCKVAFSKRGPQGHVVLAGLGDACRVLYIACWLPLLFNKHPHSSWHPSSPHSRALPLTVRRAHSIQAERPLQKAYWPQSHAAEHPESRPTHCPFVVCARTQLPMSCTVMCEPGVLPLGRCHGVKMILAQKASWPPVTCHSAPRSQAQQNHRLPKHTRPPLTCR